MSGRYSPVKAKNVVPHDIGDPGRRKIMSSTSLTKEFDFNLSFQFSSTCKDLTLESCKCELYLSNT